MERGNIRQQRGKFSMSGKYHSGRKVKEDTVTGCNNYINDVMAVPKPALNSRPDNVVPTNDY